MKNVLLVILLLIALSLIAVVLLQRSEGGGLGMGGGGGGAMSSRGAATALSKATWILGVAFMGISVAMTIISASNSSSVSVLDRLTDQPGVVIDGTSDTPSGESLLPPPVVDGDPLLPSAD